MRTSPEFHGDANGLKQVFSRRAGHDDRAEVQNIGCRQDTELGEGSRPSAILMELEYP